jgi:LuxR family maltose regulon positive regulatory protein
VAGAAALLAETSQTARQHNLVYRIPEVAAVQVLTLLRQGSLSAAAHLAQTNDLPLSQARVHLARRDPSEALAALSPWREQVEARGWQDELLKVMVLQAVALQAHGEMDQAVHLLLDALPLAEPGGFIRLFVDEGRPMAHLLSKAAAIGRMPDYIGKVLAALKAEEHKRGAVAALPAAQPLLEPLSPREVEVLHPSASSPTWSPGTARKQPIKPQCEHPYPLDTPSTSFGSLRRHPKTPLQTPLLGLSALPGMRLYFCQIEQTVLT